MLLTKALWAAVVTVTPSQYFVGVLTRLPSGDMAAFGAVYAPPGSSQHDFLQILDEAEAWLAAQPTRLLSVAGDWNTECGQNTPGHWPTQKFWKNPFAHFRLFFVVVATWNLNSGLNMLSLHPNDNAVTIVSTFRRGVVCHRFARLGAFESGRFGGVFSAALQRKPESCRRHCGWPVSRMAASVAGAKRVCASVYAQRHGFGSCCADTVGKVLTPKCCTTWAPELLEVTAA